MSGFDYSKWDRIELSDDEDTFHPNLDKGLNIRVNRITRDRKEDELDEEQTKLRESGQVEKADHLENKRPLHVDNLCHVVDERTIIQSSDGSRTDTRRQGEESFCVDEYTLFREEHGKLLDEYENADWDKSRQMLEGRGDVLMQNYTNSYFMLTALNEEMKGNRKRMQKLVLQGQIISQIMQLAEPMKRPPRDLVPRFFERMQGDASNKAFMEGVTHFEMQLINRAIDKKREEAETAEQEKELENAQPVPLVEAMYEMSVEERKGPGGLDPVEVFESLPPELQDCFKSGDVEQLEKVAAEMPDEVFGMHFKRCKESGLWSS